MTLSQGYGTVEARGPACRGPTGAVRPDDDGVLFISHTWLRYNHPDSAEGVKKDSEYLLSAL